MYGYPFTSHTRVEATQAKMMKHMSAVAAWKVLTKPGGENQRWKCWGLSCTWKESGGAP